jgi:hypothetical protein
MAVAALHESRLPPLELFPTVAPGFLTLGRALNYSKMEQIRRWRRAVRESSPLPRSGRTGHIGDAADSAVSEIFADAMVAKSELLEHYGEKESPPSEDGFWRAFHRCPVPTYLLATEGCASMMIET